MRDARRRLIGALLLALIAGDALAMRPLPLFRASERGALGGDLSALALDALLQQRSLMLDESLLELAGGVDLEELLGSSAAAVDAGGLHKWEVSEKPRARARARPPRDVPCRRCTVAWHLLNTPRAPPVCAPRSTRRCSRRRTATWS